jgi:hypothetical protein
MQQQKEHENAMFSSQDKAKPKPEHAKGLNLFAAKWSFISIRTKANILAGGLS